MGDEIIHVAGLNGLELRSYELVLAYHYGGMLHNLVCSTLSCHIVLFPLPLQAALLAITDRCTMTVCLRTNAGCARQRHWWCFAFLPSEALVSGAKLVTKECFLQSGYNGAAVRRQLLQDRGWQPDPQSQKNVTHQLQTAQDNLRRWFRDHVATPDGAARLHSLRQALPAPPGAATSPI